MLPAWVSFIIIIGIVLALSKFELGIVLTLGSVGFAILAGVDILQTLINVLTNPSIKTKLSPTFKTALTG